MAAELAEFILDEPLPAALGGAVGVWGHLVAPGADGHGEGLDAVVVVEAAALAGDAGPLVLERLVLGDVGVDDEAVLVEHGLESLDDADLLLAGDADGLDGAGPPFREVRLVAWVGEVALGEGRVLAEIRSVNQRFLAAREAGRAALRSGSAGNQDGIIDQPRFEPAGPAQAKPPVTPAAQYWAYFAA